MDVPLPVAVEYFIILQDFSQVSETSGWNLDTVDNKIERHNSKCENNVEKITVLEVSQMP